MSEPLTAAEIGEEIDALGLNGLPWDQQLLKALAECRSLRARLAAAEAKLALPCGSCHPCDNWRDEEWRRAGRKPPYPHEWDDLRSRLDAVLALCDEWRNGTKVHWVVLDTIQAYVRGAATEGGDSGHG